MSKRVSVDIGLDALQVAIGEWPSVDDAASRLGKTPQTIHDMLDDGRLKGIRTRVGWIVHPACVGHHGAILPAVDQQHVHILGERVRVAPEDKVHVPDDASIEAEGVDLRGIRGRRALDGYDYLRRVSEALYDLLEPACGVGLLGHAPHHHYDQHGH